MLALGDGDAVCAVVADRRRPPAPAVDAALTGLTAAEPAAELAECSVPPLERSRAIVEGDMQFNEAMSSSSSGVLVVCVRLRPSAVIHRA